MTASIRVALLAFLMMPAVAMAAELANAIFLVAKHEMKDPRFRETVVLVTQPPQGGPFGVIVNRPLTRLLSEIFPQHAGFKGKTAVLFRGGPVNPDGLVFLVRTSKPPVRAMHVLKDVYFTGDTEWIETLLQRPDPTRGMRVYAGYSGWGQGQLQNEMQRGDWYVLPADAETIFEKDVSRIWPDLVQRASARPTRVAPEARVGRDAI